MDNTGTFHGDWQREEKKKEKKRKPDAVVIAINGFYTEKRIEKWTILEIYSQIFYPRVARTEKKEKMNPFFFLHVYIYIRDRLEI